MKDNVKNEISTTGVTETEQLRPKQEKEDAELHLAVTIIFLFSLTIKKEIHEK